jgi:hypothetical protein
MFRVSTDFSEGGWAMMRPWRFYWLAVPALATAVYFAVESRIGSTNELNNLGFWVFALLAVLSIELGNSFRVANRRLRELDEAKSEGRALRETVAELQHCVAKEAVLERALFTLMSAKHGFTEAELLDRFRWVETEKPSIPAKKCAKCGRLVNQRTHHCLYCGAPCEVESAFEFLGLGAWPKESLQPPVPAVRQAEEHGITRQPSG